MFEVTYSSESFRVRVGSKLTCGAHILVASLLVQLYIMTLCVPILPDSRPQEEVEGGCLRSIMKMVLGLIIVVGNNGNFP